MTSGETPEMIYANALMLGETGLLLRGASGSGKSALTLRLTSWASSHGRFARLIGDDRVALVNRNGRLIARPHPAISGAIELRGLGIAPMPFEPAGVICFVVDLALEDNPPPRYPPAEVQLDRICGLSLPRWVLDAGDVTIIEKISHILQLFEAK